MKKNFLIYTFFVGALILEGAWFFFNLDTSSQNINYPITRETPIPLQQDKNLFHEPNNNFSFELPPQWTYTSTSSIHSTSSVDIWNFISENVQIATMQYPSNDFDFNSCSEQKYLYLHSYKTNDPKTSVLGEICAACEEIPEKRGLCKVSKLPNRGFIYWQKEIEGKTKNNYSTSTNQMALIKFNFSFEGMDMNKAVDIIDQIAGSVVLSENETLELPTSTRPSDLLFQ